jgi:hypothetical protein
LSFLFLIIMSGLFTKTSLSVCIIIIISACMACIGTASIYIFKFTFYFMEIPICSILTDRQTWRSKLVHSDYCHLRTPVKMKEGEYGLDLIGSGSLLAAGSCKHEWIFGFPKRAENSWATKILNELSNILPVMFVCFALTVLTSNITVS